MKGLRTLCVAIGFLFFALGTALADTITGTVSNVDVTVRRIVITKSDGIQANIIVSDGTDYTGKIGKLSDLKEGASVKIQATNDPISGDLKASSVEVPEESKT